VLDAPFAVGEGAFLLEVTGSRKHEVGVLGGFGKEELLHHPEVPASGNPE
jgi:hypothetical protein